MKKTVMFSVMALVALLAATAPAGAKPDQAQQEAKGISVEGLTLSSEFGTPTGFPTLVPTTPLEIPVTEEVRGHHRPRIAQDPAHLPARDLDAQ